MSASSRPKIGAECAKIGAECARCPLLPRSQEVFQEKLALCCMVGNAFHPRVQKLNVACVSPANHPG